MNDLSNNYKSRGMSDLVFPPNIDEGLDEKYQVAEPITDLSDTVIIDGIPITTQEKYEKLKIMINKLICKSLGHESFHLEIPIENGNTKGFAFVHSSVEDSQKIHLLFNDYKLDKNHIFKVYPFADVFAYDNIDENIPEKKEYVEKPNFKAWLKDGREQILIQSGFNVSIVWNVPIMNSKNGQTELAYQRDNWCGIKEGIRSSKNGLAKWSPRGNYMITFHDQGIAVWGGSKWTKIARFPFPNVKEIKFSPDEKYLITFSNIQKTPISVWSIETGKELLNKTHFLANSNDPNLFHWTPDSKILAYIIDGRVIMYEFNMENVVKKEISDIPTGIKGISFSNHPRNNFIAYWISEKDNTRIALFNIQTNETIVKTVVNVADCQFVWQKNGDYLVAKINRFKGKTVSYSTLVIFNFRKKDIPIDIVDLDEVVNEIYVEPNGNHIVMVGKTQFVYHLGEKIKRIHTFVKISEKIEWSPKGKILITYHGGIMYFNNVDETVKFYEHAAFDSLDKIIWNDSGRFVITYSTNILDSGYSVWNCCGRLLYKEDIKDLSYIEWRPYPKTILATKKIKDIEKNLAKYQSKFDKEDSNINNKVDESIKQARRILFEEWHEYMRRINLEIEGNSDLQDIGVELVTIETYEEEVLEETRTQIHS